MIKDDLDKILNLNNDVIDVTIELLLYVMKKQLFLDGNKRTAVIIANHYLISHGGIIVVPAELVSEYKKLLILYYEDRSDDIKLFLKNK